MPSIHRGVRRCQQDRTARNKNRWLLRLARATDIAVLVARFCVVCCVVWYDPIIGDEGEAAKIPHACRDDTRLCVPVDLKFLEDKPQIIGAALDGVCNGDSIHLGKRHVAAHTPMSTEKMILDERRKRFEPN